MKLCALLLLAACAAPVSAAPVHVALKGTASVTANADGFFTLGSVADVTGGDAATRTRLSSVPVGRAPLSGETRRVTRGDVALKLRQAGCDPDTQAFLEGAAQSDVKTVEPTPARLGSPPLPAREGPEGGKGAGVSVPSLSSLAGRTPVSGANKEVGLLHRGDAVTIVIRSDALTITAPGIAREDGRVGDTVRVHREGLMTDLSVRVLDAKTVQLEI